MIIEFQTSHCLINMDDLYEITFEWPHSHPNNVIVTGSFDNWSSSVRLTKEPSSFKGTTKIPWNEKITYKFVVDGQWLVDDGKPTESDSSGNVNNVLTAPSKPAPLAEPEVPKPSTITNVNGVDPVKAEEVPVEAPKAEVSASVQSPQAQDPTSASVALSEPTKAGNAPEPPEPVSTFVVPAEPVSESVKDAATPPVEPSTHVPVDIPAPISSDTVASPSPAETKPTAEAEPSTHTPAPAAASEPVNGTGDTAKVNGDKSEAVSVTAAEAPAKEKDTDTEAKTNGTTPSAPSTPKSKHPRSVSAIFPRSGSPNSDISPTSSRFSSIRKKRNSIFGSIRLKGLFGKDKDKEKEK
ncbi:hypothetical protein D9758_001340 [Tetrapyrgos nigripes]|uniref:AMP-activated protein kinase glycogen-binding domain-containing protein n=1 Tax=Tetrapyrgos nigripes TaxID=182062 RepID=A0A8H5GRN1_9AGAR|nr:hypothetical protein D9758_001340 [Tetrapyrgos nigripes]